MPTLTDWVAAFSQELAKRIGDKRYHLWFDQQTRFHWQDQELVVGVPNRFFLEWLQETFAHSIEAAAASVAGHPVSIRFVVDPALFQAQCRHQVPVTDATAPRAFDSIAPSSAKKVASLPDRGLHCEAPQSATTGQPEEFLVGESNRLAYAAVMQLGQAVQQSASWFGAKSWSVGIPLTLYGPHGVGKTHLLEVLAAQLRSSCDPSKILCLTAENFTNQFLQAMRQNQLVEFRRRFRSLVALLLDDMQFLEGKRATQEELLHTLETLTRQGRIFVATCDRHPRQARWLPELVDRLLGGVIWPVEPPDLDLRRQLVQDKAARLGLTLSAEVTEYLAQCVQGNVRELEGALYAVYHYACVHHQPLSLDLAQKALARWLRPHSKVVSLRDVERAVSRLLHLRPGVLRGREKVRSASYPRMLAMYLARKHTGLPYNEIGRFFGGRNHSTVIAAERKVATWLCNETWLRFGGQMWRVAELLELIEREF